jgi:hypothetical protein
MRQVIGRAVDDFRVLPIDDARTSRHTVQKPNSNWNLHHRKTAQPPSAAMLHAKGRGVVHGMLGKGKASLYMHLVELSIGALDE